MLDVYAGDIPAATKEDVDFAVEAAKRALSRNKGRDWSKASGSVRAGYLRAIAAKVVILFVLYSFSVCLVSILKRPDFILDV
jgi:hypothetical protein